MRVNRGFTQQVLADRLGEKRATIAKWEQDGSFPRASALPKLADTLGCTIDALYGRGEENENV